MITKMQDFMDTVWKLINLDLLTTVLHVLVCVYNLFILIFLLDLITFRTREDTIQDLM